MLKQPATRNQRYKGFRVKHVLQICALLAICIWLLNQVENSYDNKGSGFFRMATSEHGHVVIKLGRKDFHPQGKGSSAEINEGGLVEEEVEESAAEENEDDGRGGGDDEIDGRGQEKAEREEVEDLIDEEDREKENQIEDLSLLEDQSINEGDEQHKIDEDDEQRGVTEKLVGIPS
ncbi:hypothetical protein HRI_001398800 [Hibiscus trionum]|uniref:Uncharacterized protein n=1 Tax=Hibiscus trionum TaxID=183268 RepID=A0A9W7HGK1_HIBTR|nr:hypothetical protein HRI_001398800 [Hibiscus trionum]